MSIPDNLIGKQVQCPGCKKVIVANVPQPAAAAVGAGVGAGPSKPIGSPSVAPTSPPPPAPPKAGTAKNVCPACKSPLLEGAIACMDCGFLISGDMGTVAEGPPNLCTNEACGVANPPGERTCQRCGTPLPASPGTMVQNRYKIDRLLAMGGFGAVYLATDTKGSNRPVAIKDMICSDPQEFSIRLNFFRREAEILKSLEKLPVVPRVFDLIEQGQTAHLVLEFIKGQDLLKIMDKNGKKAFALEQVIEWGKSVCDVLQHMHSQTPPLIHRDLKPDNIMLLEDQKSIKMIDFGTARDLGRTAKERQQKKTQVYTQGYAPIEQMAGKPEPRSDLFALAATLYHLATGEEPNGSNTANEIEAKLKSGNGAIPAQNRWFFELIRINLAEDVNDRYFSARDIRNDLERRKVTTEISCGKCKHLNKVREPYCMKCAEPLTDATPPCYHCGKTNRMGSRCCIHCGNRLR
jgi:predicted Ser/Thr protein kinase